MATSKIQKQLRLLLLSTLAMFGFGFALVPLYDVFCDITGLNGKGYSQQVNTSLSIDNSRKVKVEFVTYLNKQLPWQFEPEIKSIELHPGEHYLINFVATNTSSELTTGKAVPSISPGYGAQYLVKTECFCFQDQPLEGYAKATMPLIFYIDPAIPTDMSTLTLAYTLFPNENTDVAMR